ncbi:unnamed protein product [Pleuronectes platessa]|uniref:Uncharacterized protein n=1 Tax=Pleuronectes platessa TaxID=8262 RepID=A0A9N7YPP6_PLEPL|nr:unnamed protein product [Pleuronectes platessa]
MKTDPDRITSRRHPSCRATDPALVHLHRTGAHRRLHPHRREERDRRLCVAAVSALPPPPGTVKHPPADGMTERTEPPHAPTR